MEAFADAVFAIAFTLPVVALEMPRASAGLGDVLAGMWRSFLGFGLAAAVIGIWWVHHHFSGVIFRTTGHWFNLATLLFLAAIGFIAFPARVLAQHVDDPAGFGDAVRFFMAGMAAISLTWYLKWLVGRAMRHVDGRLERHYVRRLDFSYLASCTTMVAAAGLSWLLPAVGLALAGLVIAWHLLPLPAPCYAGEAPTVDGED